MLHVHTGGTLLRTLPNPVPTDKRHRIQGARQAGLIPPRPAPTRLQRRVSAQGAIRVAGQAIQVGFPHARQIVTIVADNELLTILDAAEETIRTIPRTGGDITRTKAHREHRDSATG